MCKGNLIMKKRILILLPLLLMTGCKNKETYNDLDSDKIEPYSKQAIFCHPLNNYEVCQNCLSYDSMDNFLSDKDVFSSNGFTIYAKSETNIHYHIIVVYADLTKN